MNETAPKGADKRIAIIGGGPAGLYAADMLSGAGHSVTLFERMPSVGRKLLMAGRGGLNLTHSEALEDFLPRYREAEDWLAPAIRAFPPQALRAFAEALGQPTFIGSSGRVFPRAMKASPFLRALLARLLRQGVDIRVRHDWRGWDDGGALLFSGQRGGTVRFAADATLLALGGASWPRLGARGDWAEMLAGQGVAIAPFRPANCGFLCDWSPIFRERFAGHPLKAARFHFGSESVLSEAVITDRGIEGGALYALSAPLRNAIERTGSTDLAIDLKPDRDIKALAARIGALKKGASLATILRKAANLDPLAAALLRETTPEPPRDPVALAQAVKSVTLRLTGIADIARAISSAGGVRRTAVSDDFMLKALPGVFVAGEMLDWEAPTGGYLLQASFATAHVAAQAMIGRLAADKRPA